MVNDPWLEFTSDLKSLFTVAEADILTISSPFDSSGID